jgi:transcriptional regulator with XRE-family HTH domain
MKSKALKKWTRLINCRKDRGMTQTELARESGLSCSMISEFEAGKKLPACESLASLAIGLDVSSDYLLGRTNDMMPYSKEIARPNEYHLNRFIGNVKGIKEIILNESEFNHLQYNLFPTVEKKAKEFLYNGVIIKWKKHQ